MRVTRILRALKHVRPLIDGEFEIKPHHPVPAQGPKPHYYWSKGRTSYTGSFEGSPPVHSKSDLQRLRNAARLAADTLETALAAVKAGVTTEDLDKIVHDFILSKGGYPAPIHYMTFPKSVCASVNESNLLHSGMSRSSQHASSPARRLHKPGRDCVYR